MKTSKSTSILAEDKTYFVCCSGCNDLIESKYTMGIGKTDYGHEVRICPYCQDDYVLSEDRTAFKIKCGVKIKPFYE